MSQHPSVFIRTQDTRGLAELCKELRALNFTLVSDGDTLQFLGKSGLEVVPLFEYNANQMACHPSVEEYDLIIANTGDLCTPTPAAMKLDDIELREAAVIRRAARLGDRLGVVTSPSDYPLVLAELQSNGKLSQATTHRLAVAAITHLRAYDCRLEAGLSRSLLQKEVMHISLKEGVSLRYGENAHQSALFFKEAHQSESSLANAQQLHGKELSFNNIVDADAALEMVREFTDAPTVAIIKHLNPCGLATGTTLEQAFEAAWAGDPVSAFGSVIAVNRPVDLATAQRLKGRFVEILLAPGYAPDALEFLQKKSKDIRILQIDSVAPPVSRKVYKHVIGGMLVQDRDIGTWDKWECVTKAQFPAAKDALARFTWLVTKHTKSNAIVMGYEYAPGCFQVIGLGPGQPNRIDSNLRLCQPRVRDNAARMAEAQGAPIDERALFGEVVMGSDAFFPFPDNIEASHQAGVRFIVQPGGSVKDPEVIAACDQLGIAMVFTGMRHFRH
jgi:phosphoribosylaminoimidazolecarboxamide formyltransferase / IMP cyclohydrolase